MQSHRLTVARIVVPLLLSLAAPWVNAATPRADYTATDRLIVRFKDGAHGAVTTIAAPLPGKATTHSALSTKLSPAEQATQRQIVARRLQRLTTETLSPLRTMADGAHIIRLSRRLPLHEVNAIAKLLAKDPEVLEVLLDRLYFAQATPTDPQYANQWNLTQASGINMPGAWDITTGSPSLVVAVLDTGMLPHNDLAGRWIGGYDFVSLAERSNDGNLRDGDATDPGDWVTAGEVAAGQPLDGCAVTDSRWHGTAMAGVIAANANNGGISGINWNSKILPVRVVGKCGGYESDIADALRWAVGLAVAGVPNNPNPAKVINVSLAASGACSSTLQNAINDVIATSTPIVAAAGNQSANANGYSPGNCANVITVGAVDKNGGKPSYANFGTNVTLSAPGGLDGTNNSATNVLTTQNEGTTAASANNDFYRTTFGTSVATAQVTGIVSLILSINPQLTPQNIKDILQNTSRAFPTNTNTAMPNPSQADCATALCGAGIPSAMLAVQVAQRWGTATSMVAAGSAHGLGLRSDGVLISWGDNTIGQLGIGAFVNESVIPVQVNLSGVIRIAAGQGHTLALRADGTVWTWGYNLYGQLGDGTTTSRSAPAQVVGLTDITEIAAGAFHALARKSDGTVWAWGINDIGQLGDGTTNTRLTPVQVAGLANVGSIAAGTSHSLARKNDSTVWAWGGNFYGQLGDGSVSTRLSPVPVSALANVASIATGAWHSLARKSDGTVWAWGNNEYGQLGDGTTTFLRTVPAQVSGLTDITMITAGVIHSLGRKSDGSVWAWGNNGSGELGDGTRTTRLTPVQVVGLTSVTAIAGGGNFAGRYGFSIAMNNDGSVVSWGGNGYGQLGDGTNQTRLVPNMVLATSGTAALNLNVSSSSFAPVTFAFPSSAQISNAVIVTGIANGSTISVSGGEYRIGGGMFTNTSGTINPGQTVTLRQSASAGCNATTTATVTIAGSPRSFTVTTMCDVVPEPFVFFLQSGVPLSSVLTSNSITVTGINVPAPISITGGEYSIGCIATYSTAPGTISNGQMVCVRQIASANYDVQTNATLSIGGVSAAFAVITLSGPGFSGAAMLAAGDKHVIGLRADGALFGWGGNASGQLGIGPVSTNSLTPVRLNLSGAIQVAAGSDHTLALRADGTVWAWGNNSAGALGDGTTMNRNTPVQIVGLTGVTEIAAGYVHSMARKNDGTVWAWGENFHGQLGDGTTTTQLTPVQVVGLANVGSIAAGEGHSLARKNDGTVWAWGDNLYGQLGDGTVSTRLTPAPVSALVNVVSIATDRWHSLARKSDGTVWAWGKNDFGQLGDGTTTLRSVPVQSSGLTDITMIAAGESHSIGLKSDGSVWTWGNNAFGGLGDGTRITRLTPGQVAGLANVTAIAAGGFMSYAINNDGTVVSWGFNGSGQLGDGSLEARLIPTFVLAASGTAALNLNVSSSSFAPVSSAVPSSVQVSNAVIVTGIVSSSAISVAGGEYRIDAGMFTNTPGTINSGQTVTLRQTASAGCNTTTTTAVTIAGTTSSFNVTTIACGNTPDLFEFLLQSGVPLSSVRTSNSVTITGINVPAPISVTGGEYSLGCTATFTAATGTIANGQVVCVRQTASAINDVQTNTTLTIGGVSAAFPVITLTSPGFSGSPMLTAGSAHAMGLRSDGALFGWGGDSSGLLGTGRNFVGPSNIPVQVNLSGVTKVAIGMSHTLALRGDGTVWAWGNNGYGGLGDGTTTHRTTPVQVVGLSGVTEIAAGHLHSLARKNDGTVWAWGNNFAGQLGDGSTNNQVKPIQVVGLANVVSVAAGQFHSLARKDDGTVWAWGNNYYGQLGDGTEMNRGAPVQVVGLSGVTEIASGLSHSLARKNDGTVWAWGSNSYGQLGEGTTTNHVSPAQVVGLTGVTEIAAAHYHSMARKNDSTVWAWGSNGNGELGNGTRAMRATPVQVLGLVNVSLIGAGGSSSYAMNTDGSVVSWGRNESGQLGDGTGKSQLSPILVQPAVNFPDDALHLLGVGIRPAVFSLAPSFGVPLNSSVVCKLFVVSGLGVGTASPIMVFGGEYSINGGAFVSSAGTTVNGDTVVVRVLSSSSFSTTTSATLNIGGTSGRSSTFYVRTRRSPDVSAIVPQVALGNSHSYLLNADATTYAVGYNGNGQLGTGTTFGTSVLRPVSGLPRTIAIASGAYHGLALRDDLTAVSWGYNAGGQLGSGIDNNSELNTVNVVGLSGVVAISAGDYHSLALKQDGTVWAWGLNVDGQIGQGNITTSRYLTPIQVPGLSGVTAIAAGGRHNLAVLANGSVVAWGSNSSGQLGDGTLVSRSSPVPVSTLTSGVLSVYAGGAHSLALKTDSTAVAWGNNDFGQLGDGSNTNRTAPVSISSLGTGVALLAAGTSHSLAVKVGGVLFSWGANTNSQLGDNALVNRNTPFQFTTITNVVAIAAGGRHSAALTRQKKLNIFGDNYFGQVGSKSGNYNPHSGSLNILRGDSQISQGIAAASSSIGTSGFSGSALLELSGIAAGIFFPRTAVADSAITIGTFTNTSSADTYPSISVTLPTGAPFFALTDNQCTAQIIPGGQCTFQITFAPTAATAYGGSVKVTSPAGEQSLSLTGDGQANGPVLSLPGLPPDQSTLLFESVQLGGQSDTQSIVVKNDGDPALLINPIASTSDFQITANSCDPALAPSGIAPNGTCQIDVRFSPNGQGLFSAGTRSAVLTLVSNGGSRTVTLSGTAVYSANDTVPDGFTDFTSQPGVATNTERTSNAQTINGINAPAPVSIANGSYAIGCTGTFTNQPGSISSGQTVCVRHNSAASASTTVTTTLTIGGVSGSFSSTTAGGSFLLTVNKAGAAASTGIVTSTVPASPTITCAAGCSSNSATFNAGTNVTLTVTPVTGVTFTGWSGGGAGCTGTGSCVVTMDAAKSITATFTLNTYTVTPSTGANGSISPSGNQTVNHGATLIFTLTPNAGYSPTVTGTCTGSLVGNVFTTNAITGNCSVMASFTQLPASTTALSSSSNPSGVGQAVTFTATVTGSGATPTGTVTFREGGNVIAGCNAMAMTGGTAQCVTTTLPKGAHAITAQYGGSVSYAASTSNALTQNVTTGALEAVIYLLLD